MRTTSLSLAALLLASGALLAGAPAAAAQERGAIPAAPADSTGAVVGFVTDSTSGELLAGAMVQLVLRDRPESSFSAVTDATGAFRIDAVPRGIYLAGFFHPRLDSLDLDAPTYLVNVGAGETPLTLALPSPATIVAASCELAPGDSSGLLFGRVVGADDRAALRGARVTVEWPEIVIDGGLRTERREIVATTNESGRFALCGVPTDAELVVHAALGSDATGALAMRIPPRGMLHRELTIGRGDAAVAVATDSGAGGARVAAPRRGTARLDGIVRREDGEPFANARVAVHGALPADTTGADGRFTLDALPAGTHTLEVRAIGYTPQRAVVDLASGRTDTATVTVSERVATLDAVTIYGKARPRGRLVEFLERQRRSAGRFLTAAEIEKRNAFDVTDLFRMMPGVRVVNTGGFGGSIVMGYGSDECSPAVFLDGMKLFEGAADISTLVQPHHIAGIEVYNRAMQVPPQFYGDGCGSIVIWTKGVL